MCIGLSVVSVNLLLLPYFSVNKVFIVSENSLCMLFANDARRQLHNIFYTIW